MAGIFGNSDYDRAMERQLHKHLEDEDKWICPWCSYEGSFEKLGNDTDTYNPETDAIKCPKCERETKI